MAAVAHDTAAFYFRGYGVGLNFPELLDMLPRPTSSKAEDVRVATQEGSLLLLRKKKSEEEEEEGGRVAGSVIPMTDGLSPSQIQAIHEQPLDSPNYKMWMDNTDGIGSRVLGEEPFMITNHPNDYYDMAADYEEVHDDFNLWNL
ncbi:hypothetical protein M9H77_18221 [Catharanthus roseus]|uniref:Uncharacterized protein n=1 Tax=Catharanthus roseus TaxID=4058 RepID=A0ACC0B6W1_CATRO|nr:hypothetical protein M9H77_18221 [Catharanthus roseus]